MTAGDVTVVALLLFLGFVVPLAAFAVRRLQERRGPAARDARDRGLQALSYLLLAVPGVVLFFVLDLPLTVLLAIVIAVGLALSQSR